MRYIHVLNLYWANAQKTFISMDGVVAPVRPAPAALVHPCTSYAKAMSGILLVQTFCNYSKQATSNLEWLMKRFFLR